MEIIKEMQHYDHEQVVYFQNSALNLKAIIAIHNTALGPALGGTRFLNYANEESALYDVLRLSRGMSFKNAAAGLPLGGGKAVIIGDPNALKSKAFFKAYGVFINRLNGLYYTAEDVNTNEEDMDTVHTMSDYVVGLSHKSGNPSPFTARGVFQGIKAAVHHRFGTTDLTGMRIAISGLGSVGYALLPYLHKAGATLLVADVNTRQVDKAVQQFNAKAMDPNEISFAECELFAPCALGAIIHRENVAQLKCGIIAGAANNVLVDQSAGDALDQAGILYIPDYIINAGGVINVASEITGDSSERVLKRVDNIYNTVTTVIQHAERAQISTSAAADAMALEMIQKAP